MTENPDQNQPAPDPSLSNLGVTDSPTVEQHRAMVEQDQANAPEELKGEALDKALESAGLPKTGTADEKRARLAESKNQGQATQQAQPTDQGAPSTGDSTSGNQS